MNNTSNTNSSDNENEFDTRNGIRNEIGIRNGAKNGVSNSFGVRNDSGARSGVKTEDKQLILINLIQNNPFITSAKMSELSKHEIADNTTGRQTFIDIYEVYDGDMRVVMFKIPAAVTGVPTAWKGHWYGREGESLSPLSQEEIDRIRGQALPDWSSRVIENSDIKYLDSEAIRIARENYKRKKNREHISTGVLGDKLSDILDDKQKDNKVRTLLAAMHKNSAKCLLMRLVMENKCINVL